MKKYLVSLLAFSFSLLALPEAVLASTLSLSPATGVFNRSCSFSLNIVVDTAGAQTDGTDAILFYDASRFSAQSITNGSIYPDFPGNNIDASSGKITISGLASVSTPFSGTGTLASVNFIVNDTSSTGATQVTFDFDPNNKAKTIDSNVVERGTVVDTLNSVVNGSYTIGSGTCGAAGGVSPAPQLPRGAVSTPSAEPKTVLPPAGTPQLTSALVIVGALLAVLGILGLALL